MSPESPSTLGILAALEGELGTLAARRGASRRVLGVEVRDLDLPGRRALVVVSGIGKVRAAHAAAALLAAGVDRALLVVGTCGSLTSGFEIGDLVHGTSAHDWSDGSRHDRESASDPELVAAWSSVAAGKSARFVSVHAAVTSPWRRYALARSRAGRAVVDMETAAAALVAASAGVPWAVLRVVTDHAGFGAGKSFKQHYAAHGGRAADTLPELARRIS
jgi:adenosylhomocysteine nucleosidase